MMMDEDRYLIVDPIFQGVFWLIKDFTPMESTLNTMPAPDHVLITHGHYDHLDEPVYLPPVQIKQELEKEGLIDRLVDLEHGHTLFLNSKSKHIDFRNGLVVSN